MASGLAPGWRIVLHPDIPLDEAEAARILNEALAAAPEAVRMNDSQVLPRRRLATGVCRICGVAGPLSREHIPPKAAGNTGTYREHSLTEWFERDALDDLPRGRWFQGGSFAFVLCGGCNSRTGRFATEYARWSHECSRLASRELPDIRTLDLDRVSRRVHVQLVGARPGLFVRQALSMMVSLSGDWPLTARHPELAATLLDGTPCA